MEMKKEMMMMMNSRRTTVCRHTKQNKAQGENDARPSSSRNFTPNTHTHVHIQSRLFSSPQQESIAYINRRTDDLNMRYTTAGGRKELERARAGCAPPSQLGENKKKYLFSFKEEEEEGLETNEKTVNPFA